MSEEDSRGRKASPEERTPLQGGTGRADPPEEGKGGAPQAQEDTAAVSSGGTGSGRGGLRRGLGRHKWKLFTLAALLTAAAGLWGALERGWIGARQGDPGSSPLQALQRDGLLEETLPPFFVPLPSDSKTRVVMIVSAAVWDGVASVRYRKLELRIRDRLYKYIADLAARKSLQEMPSYLESEMSRILREVLGLAELEVKIKEIRAF